MKMKRRQLKELFNRLLAVSANFLCHTDSVFLLYYSACNRKDDWLMKRPAAAACEGFPREMFGRSGHRKLTKQ